MKKLMTFLIAAVMCFSCCASVCSAESLFDQIMSQPDVVEEDILTPVIEEDNMTVYGALNGNKTYTSTFGQSITIPWVKAERINVK